MHHDDAAADGTCRMKLFTKHVTLRLHVNIPQEHAARHLCSTLYLKPVQYYSARATCKGPRTASTNEFIDKFEALLIL